MLRIYQGIYLRCRDCFGSEVTIFNDTADLIRPATTCIAAFKGPRFRKGSIDIELLTTFFALYDIISHVQIPFGGLVRIVSGLKEGVFVTRQ